MIKSTCLFLFALLISNLVASRTDNYSLILKIDEDDASFFMTPTCDGATATITGDSGGTFAFNPVPSDGAMINVVTGEVTSAISGYTYSVEYTIGGGTPESLFQTFTVLLSGDASFIMTPDCSAGAIVTVMGDIGGVFSFDPETSDGSVIDAVTGEITDGINGTTYTVKYTTSGVCTGLSFENVTVYTSPEIVIPTPLISCDLDGNEDGFYLFNLNEKNSEILNGLDPNLYAVSYYETQANAETDVNPLIASGYYNVIGFIQTIYVRVENLNAGCFTTTTLDLIVDVNCPTNCEENTTICYTNNDTTEYIFTSDDGGPMYMFFQAGQMEVCCDFIFIYDSDNTLIYQGNNNGNLAGLLIYATGDTITLRIESNGSGSCETDNYIPIEFSIPCTTTNTAIIVNSFYDENSNTIFDASENNFNAGEFTYEVNNDGVIHYVNASNGRFYIPNLELSNSYDVGFILSEDYEGCLNSTFTLIEDVIPLDGDVIEVNFPFTPIATCNDIAVSLISYVPPRPGVAYTNKLIIKNLGTISVSGSVEFTHDPLLTLNNVILVDAGNTVTNTSTGFILNFNNLQPGNSEEVHVVLDVPTGLNIGDFLTNTVVYDVNDLNLDNNTSILTEEVVNSYDPNNKIESHGPEIKIDDFTNEDYLFYTINFQNLGTADAINIRVEDLLDNQLDATSFKMLNASHDFVVTRIDNNLTWQFEDINLPSESMDEPNSHGYVYFKIKPLSGYTEGDVIPNTANIYFDFNPAVTTNTFETEFVNSLTVAEFNSTQFSMYPNPASDLVNVLFNMNVDNYININIFDLQGKVVLKTKSVSEFNTIKFNVSNISKGMYFIELIGSDFKMVAKLIIE